MLNEKYWVISNGEDPLQIYFSLAEAMNSQAAYIDSFDDNGVKVKSMKRVDEHNYTTDF